MGNDDERYTVQLVDACNTARCATLTIAGQTEIRARNSAGRVASALDMGVAHFYAAEPLPTFDTARERDEAREALRELRDALKATYGPPRGQNTRLDTAVQRTGAVLEGVERTHALVPLAALKRAAEASRSVAGFEFAEALLAAARGERVEWPS